MVASRALFVAFCLVATACTTAAEGSIRVEIIDSGAVHTPEPSPDAAQPSTDFEALPEDASLIVRAGGPTLEVFADRDGDDVTLLPSVDDGGTVTTLGAIGRPVGEWLRVQLAERPNFTSGWVHVPSVSITWTRMRIVVELDRQLLTLYEGSDVITFGTVAIGTDSTPTPKGSTFVAELLASQDPVGLYGPFAIGLALFSDEVTEYAGGNGQIGIHGTNRPDLLGTPASLGCVRTHNDLISELAGRVPLGTPVVII